MMHAQQGIKTNTISPYREKQHITKVIRRDQIKI